LTANITSSTGNDKATVNKGSVSSIPFAFLEDIDGIWVFYSATCANTFDVTGIRCIYKDYSENDGELFQKLKKKWHKERGSTSSTTKIVACLSYYKIIGMGPRALPFILRDILRNPDNPDHWFWALEMITRANPVPANMYGRHAEMARAWLSWADEQGVSIDGLQESSRTLKKTIAQ
jgi:hypothetical protein